MNDCLIVICLLACLQSPYGETFAEYFCETCGSSSMASRLGAGSAGGVSGANTSKPKTAGTSPAPGSRRSFGGENGSSFSENGNAINGSNANSVGATVAAGGYCWCRPGPSSSGTCLVLESSFPNSSSRVPSLQLTWKGDEPLDRLHLVLKVMPLGLFCILRC